MPSPHRFNDSKRNLGGWMPSGYTSEVTFGISCCSRVFGHGIEPSPNFESPSIATVQNAAFKSAESTPHTTSSSRKQNAQKVPSDIRKMEEEMADTPPGDARTALRNKIRKERKKWVAMRDAILYSNAKPQQPPEFLICNGVPTQDRAAWAPEFPPF